MVEIRESKGVAPDTSDTSDAGADTRLSDLESTVAELVERVSALEKKQSNKGLANVRDRVEDVCDFLYGNNVRPPLKDRSDGEYAAEVKPSNEDD